MRPLAGNPDAWQQALLACGIAAPLLHIAIDRLAGARFKGYDYAAQSMSDLSASGSPSRTLVVTLTFVATALMVGFAAGVWRSSAGAVLPRIVASLILGNAVLGLAATVIFPMQLGERPAFGTPGVILMFLSVLCFVLAMLLGAIAFGGWMRALSIGIPAMYVALGLLRYATAGSAQSASLIGTQERTMAYSYLIWVIALAVQRLLAAGILHRLPGASN